jgi:alpha-tubulin suppressor-like RCC1 family protein
VVSLSCGYWHSCAVLRTGEAYCWGFGTQGQLGTHAAANADTPALVSLPGLPPARSVHAGSGALSSCVELQSGEIYCFGFNYYGQLGLGADGQLSTVLAPTRVRDWP